MREDKTIAQISAEYEVHPTQLNKWKSLSLTGLPSLFEEKDSLVALKANHEEQLNKLYAEIGVSITNPEFCTLSKMGGLTDFLMWLHKRIEEKGCEFGTGIYFLIYFVYNLD